MVFNSRGTSDSPVVTAQFYSASFTEDMRCVSEQPGWAMRSVASDWCAPNHSGCTCTLLALCFPSIGRVNAHNQGPSQPVAVFLSTAATWWRTSATATRAACCLRRGGAWAPTS